MDTKGKLMVAAVQLDGGSDFNFSQSWQMTEQVDWYRHRGIVANSTLRQCVVFSRSPEPPIKYIESSRTYLFTPARLP